MKGREWDEWRGGEMQSRRKGEELRGVMNIPGTQSRDKSRQIK